MYPPKPADEDARLRALYDLEILDTGAEEEYDQVVALASRICGAPVSVVNLVDADRQWSKARLGVDVAETTRELSFCAYAILGRDVLVVPDARGDARFADNPAVARDNGVRFYAGAPLVTSDGFSVGTLCVVDTKPRRLTLDQVRALRALARQVTAHMELRHLAANLNGAGERMLAQERGLGYITGLVGGELRAPVEALRAYLAHLDRDRDAAPDPALATAAAGIVRRHAAAFGRLADCLLGVAGGDRDADLRMQHADLTRLTVRAVEAVRPIADAKRIWILSRPGPDLPILADPLRLEQALMQLLFAAVKYTPDGGRVKVSTEVEAGPAVRVDDLDTTAGHASLFEHLYYGAIAQPPRDGAPDAGLAVTKRVLDMHHATLALSDRPGDCTSLHVVFP